MSFFKKETLEDHKGLTAAAVVVGAGVAAYLAYNYYKDNLKGGKPRDESQKEPNEEVTFRISGTNKETKDGSLSNTFDKLEDLSKDNLKKDADSNESFIVFPKDLSNLPDPSKKLEQVSDKIAEGAKNIEHKLEDYKQDANENLDAVNKTVEGYKEDINTGIKQASDQIKKAYQDSNEKVKEGTKQAAAAVEDFKNVTHDNINDAAKQTSDSLHGMADVAHNKLDEGASDLSKKF